MLVLTPENLSKLADITNSYNEFIGDYLTKPFKKAMEDLTETTSVCTPDYWSVFLIILYYANFELYKIEKFEKEAIKFLEKDIKEMPLYINQTLGYNWIPIVARWRLSIGL